MGGEVNANRILVLKLLEKQSLRRCEDIKMQRMQELEQTGSCTCVLQVRFSF